MNLVELLDKENIFIAQTFKDTNGFYSGFVKFLADRGIIKNKREVKRLFVKRESVHSTAVGKGAATPHIFSGVFSEFLFSIAFIREGVDFKAPDKGSVFLVFLLMSDEREVGRHLKILGRIGRLVQSTDVVEAMKKLPNPNPDELYNILLTREKTLPRFEA